MAIKTDVLRLLKSADGPISGQEIARRLGVSRTAVWKQVRQLRDDGYRIAAASKVGYRLVETPDRLLPIEIEPYFGPDFSGEILYFPEIGSTNDAAKSWAAAGAPHGSVVVAEVQRGGRGRLGRSWRSPAGGIWFTLILRPDLSVAQASRVAILAAVVAAEAIRRQLDLPATIKWPNDVLIDGKKVAGILTELDAELGHTNYVVVGIGINANFSAKRLGPELVSEATTLREAVGRPIDRRRLLGEIAARLAAESSRLADSFSPVLDRWRRLSATLGKRVTVRSHGRLYEGVAVDVDSEGALVVRLDGGRVEVFKAGEVTLAH